MRAQTSLLGFLLFMCNVACGDERTSSTRMESTSTSGTASSGTSAPDTTASEGTLTEESTSGPGNSTFPQMEEDMRVCPPQTYSTCSAPANCNTHICDCQVFDKGGCPRAACSATSDCGPNEYCKGIDVGQDFYCDDSSGSCACGADPVVFVEYFCVPNTC